MEYHRREEIKKSYHWQKLLASIAVFRVLLLLSVILYFAVMFNEWADNQSRIHLDMGHRELRRFIITMLMGLGALEWVRLLVEEQSIYRRLIGVLGWTALSVIAVMLALIYVPPFMDWAAGILGGEKMVKKYMLRGLVWTLAPLGVLATIKWAAERVSRFIREDDINVTGSDNG